MNLTNNKEDFLDKLVEIKASNFSNPSQHPFFNRLNLDSVYPATETRSPLKETISLENSPALELGNSDAASISANEINK